MTPDDYAFAACCMVAVLSAAAWLLSHLTDRSARQAREARQRAASRFAAARRRRDTRGQHETWPSLRDATTDQLRREVGR